MSSDPRLEGLMMAKVFTFLRNVCFSLGLILGQRADAVLSNKRCEGATKTALGSKRPSSAPATLGSRAFSLSVKRRVPGGKVHESLGYSGMEIQRIC